MENYMDMVNLFNQLFSPITPDFSKALVVQQYHATKLSFEEFFARDCCLVSWRNDTPLAARSRQRPYIDHSNLRPVYLFDLQVEKLHEGCVLYGTLCVDPYKVHAIWSVLETEQGAVHVSIYDEDDAWRLKYCDGKRVAIKEPYFRFARGTFSIRVDNPNSIQEIGIMTSADDSETASVVNRLKAQGNQYFNNKEWKQAITSYTECIEKCREVLQVNSSLKQVLLAALANRAEAFIKVEDYDNALVDSNNALRIDSKHLKSICRKGRALLGLHEYERAVHWLRKAVNSGVALADVQGVLEVAQVCNKQSSTGEFNIKLFLMRQAPPPRCSDFVGPVLVRKASGNGRRVGLFVTRDVKAGDLLVVNNALVVDEDRLSSVYNFPPQFEATSEILGPLMAKLSLSRRAIAQFKVLVESKEMDEEGMNVFRANNGIVWEEATELVDLPLFSKGDLIPVILKHTFDLAVPYAVCGNGIWALPSLMRHSCLPNVSVVQVGKAMFVHAARDVKAGEELTLSYFDTLLPYEERAHLAKMMGFRCECKRCVLERSVHKQLCGSQETYTNPDECTRMVEKMLQKMKNVSEEQKCWIRASYISAYVRAYKSLELLVDRAHTVFSLEELIKVVEKTVPGHSFAFCTTCGLLAAEGMVNGKVRGENMRVVDHILRMHKALFGNTCDVKDSVKIWLANNVGIPLISNYI